MAATHGVLWRNVCHYASGLPILRSLVPSLSVRYLTSGNHDRTRPRPTYRQERKREQDTPQQEDVLADPDYFQVHNLFTLKELFNAGVHYGHHEGCWNPLMKPYLYGTREHMHIIDLNQTVAHFRLALNVLCHIVYRGGKVLFVSTNPQFEEVIQKLGRDCGEYFITHRWRGGTFTNSHMVLETRNLPDLVVFLHLPSLGRNLLAVKETAMCNIPSIGIVDSDCNPNLIMYPIPGNDDMPTAVQLYCRVFKSAVQMAKEKRKVMLATKRTRGLVFEEEEMEEPY